MVEATQDSAIAYATALLSHYGFELGGYTAQELVARWRDRYLANWVRLAVIEALYQGRYKAVSVEQLLAAWNRRGRPIYHFNHEFERLISRKIPQNIAASPDAPSVIPNDTYNTTEFLSDPPVLEENIGVGSNAPLAHQKPLAPATLDMTETPVKADVANGNSTAAARYDRDWEWEWERQELGYRNAGASQEKGIKTFNPVAVDARPEKADIPVSSNPDRDVKEEELFKQEVISQADWEEWEASKRSIHQFMPTPDKSDFYLKLKAVADYPEDFLDDAAVSAIDER